MRFGPRPLEGAEGCILAHSLRLSDGTLMRKGRTLTAEDLEALGRSGHAEVTVVSLEPSDVGEDEAASTLARSLAGTGTEVRRPGTGRCNVVATVSGVLTLDRERIEAANEVDESVTIATLPPDVPVHVGDLLATVKIIPFATSRAALQRCVEAAAEGGRPPVRVWAFRPRSVALIQTTLAGAVSDELLDRTEDALAHRVEALGSDMALSLRCSHEVAEVTHALRETVAAGCDPILVMGASAVGDRGDVVPEAIESAGGTVSRFGIPVDPGNLTLLARHGDRTVLGVPGCARSRKRNGFDLVLERVLAGRFPDAHELASWGVGGLLQEPPDRPQPRRAQGVRPRSHRVAGVVLAGGRSRRMGDSNKLLETVEGRPIVRKVVEEVMGLPIDPVVVVTGHDADAVREALSGLPVQIAHNPDFADGMSTSIRTGVEAVAGEVDGALIILGDMPWLSHVAVAALLDAFAPGEGRGICVPVVERKRGNPVLWASRYFGDLCSLEGDVGGRGVLAEYVDDVHEVPVAHHGVLMDVDTPEALTASRDPAPEAASPSTSQS